MVCVPRRHFLLVFVALTAASLDAAAQQSSKLPRVGYLAFNKEATGGHILIAFRQTMQELGWVDGQSIIIETRFADGEVRRLPTLVDDLIRLKVDVIVVGSSATTRAAKSATTTIPIVMLASADAVGERFVDSLARPGQNVTGLTLLAGPEIASKQLELLREIAPAAKRVAVLINPLNGSHAAFAAELTTAAHGLGTQLQLVEAGAPRQIDDAFAAMAKQRAMAILALSDAMFLGERRRIVDLARRGELPAMYSQREFIDAGGLVSYGPSLIDMSRRGARQVDKILRGADPKGIPVEQPTKFDLVINLKTARDLGLTIPRSLLARADDVKR
jgi:putative tryptophan/tyrosine transport system substrate-binding protein